MVRNGYKPELILKLTEDELKLGEEEQKTVQEIMEETFASWKELVGASETPWALCEDCYKSIQIYIQKRGSCSVRYEPVVFTTPFNYCVFQ